jgi:hypothetical protein
MSGLCLILEVEQKGGMVILTSRCKVPVVRQISDYCEEK